MKIHMDQLIPPHVGDAALVSFLDGELPESEQEAVQAHLCGCWSCRSRLKEMQENIDLFLEMRKRLQPESLPPAGPAMAQFRQRLFHHQPATSIELDHFRQRLSEWAESFVTLGRSLFSWRRPALTAAAISVLIVLLMVQPMGWTLSASTVLARADLKEFSEVHLGNRVARSTVQIDRIDLSSHHEVSLGRVEVVRDSSTPSVYLNAEFPTGQTATQTFNNGSNPSSDSIFRGEIEDPLIRYFAEVHWIPDVTVAGYKELISGRGSDEASLIREGEGFDLEHSFAPNHESGILKTSLLVDASSYTPLRICIYAQNGDKQEEYRFTRTSFELVPRSVEIAQLFDASSKTVPLGMNQPDLSKVKADHPWPPVELKKPPRPLTYFNSAATATEVATALALHRIGACSGEDVHIFPMSDGSILVQGLVDKPQRRGEIREALTELHDPFIHVEIYDSSEPRTGLQLYDPPDQISQAGKVSAGVGNPPVIHLDVPAEPMPIYDYLYSQLLQKANASGLPPNNAAIQRQITEISNNAVELSNKALIEAWALKKLDVEFSSERTSHLTAEASAQIEAMRHDHQRTLQSLAHHLKSLLDEFAPEAAQMANKQFQLSGNGGALDAVVQQNELVRSLFTASSELVPSPSTELAKLVVVLSRIE